MARKHLNWYCRTFAVADQTRRNLLQARDCRQQRMLAFSVFDGASDGDSVAA